MEEKSSRDMNEWVHEEDKNDYHLENKNKINIQKRFEKERRREGREGTEEEKQPRKKRKNEKTQKDLNWQTDDSWQ